MKDTMIRTGIASFAGVFAVGFLTVMPTSASSGSEAAVMKRDEKITLVSTVEDDDDGDFKLLSVSRASKPSKATVSKASRVSKESRASRNSRVSRDKTNSRVTPVSRDRDKSRGDLTRDWTMDGGDRTRDWTANSTNDRSKHDTRGKRR